MAISSLGVTSRTIIQATLTNGGVHLFTTGSLTGLLSVKATNTITVVLGRSTASNGTLSAQSGVNFTVGADNFDTVLVYGNIGDELVIDFTPVTTSTATTTPSWLSLAGYTFASNTYVTQPTKILWPVDVVTVANALPSGRQYAAGCSDSGVAGYMFGGYVASTGNPANSIDRYTFPNDTASTIAATMVATRYYHVAYSNSANHAYVTNGFYNGTWTLSANPGPSTRDKFAYPTMTRTVASISQGYTHSGSCADGHDSGYIVAGTTQIGTPFNGTGTVQRHYFATDVNVTGGQIQAFVAQLFAWIPAASHNGDRFVYTVGMIYNQASYPTNSSGAVPNYFSLGSFPFFYLYATQTSGTYVARFQKPNALSYGGHLAGTIHAHSGYATYFCGGNQVDNSGGMQLIEKCAVATNTTSTSTLTNGISAPSGNTNFNSAFDNNGVY